MKKIYIEISDKEFQEIQSLLNFIKLKVGIKKTFFYGIFKIAEKNIDDEKTLEILQEVKKRIGLL